MIVNLMINTGNSLLCLMTLHTDRITCLVAMAAQAAIQILSGRACMSAPGFTVSPSRTGMRARINQFLAMA